MQSSTSYKDLALQSLTGNWGDAVVLTYIYGLITGILGIIPYLGSVLALLIGMPMGWAFTVAFLGLTRGEELKMGRLADGFNDYVRILGTTLLVQIYTFLWTLLLIVPGIIKSFSYAMTPFVLRDEPDMKYNSAIERSMQLMDGHKMELFMLYISFIGWAILACLSIGIGFLWLVPYMETTLAKFYEDLVEGETQTI